MTLGSKKSVYEEDDNLEDDTLRLIINPQDQKGTKYKLEKHPNAITFDKRDTLYVGDSQGQVHFYRVTVSINRVQVVDHGLIKHKELEGDQINEIIVHPEHEKQIYVQSRDNCIRLVDYGSSRGTTIKKRFFGSKCANQMVQCTLSPDG